MGAKGRWKPQSFIAGDPALELANTISHRRNAVLAEDRIEKSDDLADWVGSLGLEGEVAPDIDAAARDTRDLRENVYRVFSAIALGIEPPRADIARLLAVAAAGFDRPDLPRLNEYLAWRSVQALVSIPKGRMGMCPECGWLFHDTSKAGRRRWCSMATCGTATKVRVFRTRKGAGP